MIWIAAADEVGSIPAGAINVLYAVLRPQWGRAKAQLWSFLPTTSS